MVVICTRCATQFQFDESRLPLEGAKVRCSRCTEAFFLAHPQATPESEGDVSGEGLFVQSESELSPPSQDPVEGAFGSDVEVGGESFEDDPKWEFDFDASSELHGIPDEVALPVASVMEDRSGSASRSVPKNGEQAVFASAADLADWLADRTDTLEPEPASERIRDLAEPDRPALPPPSVKSASVPLGRMVKRSLDAETSQEGASESTGDPSPEHRFASAANAGDSSFEALLADWLGTPEGPLPRWFRSGIRSAVQVLGWGITLTLVTTGLIKGLRLALW